MQIPKNVQEKILGLLQQGYSASSVCFAISKTYNVELKPSDVIIIAKKHNIKIGNKDITKEKVKVGDAVKAFPQLWKNKEFRKQIIKIGIIGISVLAVIVVACILIF